jgi:hypothetical protein
MNAVVSKQHGQALRVGQVINRHDVKVAGPLYHGSEHQSADPAKSVDAYFYCH